MLENKVIVVMNIPLQVQIDDFAERCFRDMADKDYISARFSYRAKLTPQFYWAGLQAIEKYFKAIFLFNRIRAKNLRHDLNEAMEKTQELPFDLEFSETSKAIIETLNLYGKNRYLDNSILIDRNVKLNLLDKLVWEVRRYCRPINLDRNDTKKVFLDTSVEEISKAEYPSQNQIKLGTIEKILKDKSHPARSALVWQNGFYSLRKRKTVRIPLYKSASFAPIDIFPDLISEIDKYVYIPKIAKEKMRGI